MKTIASRLKDQLGKVLLLAPQERERFDPIIRDIEQLENGRGPFSPDKLRGFARMMRRFECYPSNDPLEFADRLEATADVMERPDEDAMPEDKDFYVQDDPDSEEANINYLRIVADQMAPTPRAVTLAAIREIQRYRERYANEKYDPDIHVPENEPYSTDGLRAIANMATFNLPSHVVDRLHATAEWVDELENANKLHVGAMEQLAKDLRMCQLAKKVLEGRIKFFEERYHDEDWAAVVGIEPYTPDGLRSLAQIVEKHLSPSTGVEPDFVAQRLRATAHRIEVFDNERDELVSDNDESYRQRNVLVRALASIFPSGIRKTDIEDWDPEWHNCCFIDLPTGQISYHYHDSQQNLFAGLPPYEKEWDGHDKAMVETRLAWLEDGEKYTNWRLKDWE